jgi:D-amino peptidase
MVGEANAAIAGAVAAGATDVLVNDSHGGMYNLRPEALDPAARVLQGQKSWSMVAGAARPDGAALFDVALFVGYHARAGHPTGTIAHTYTGGPVETRLNGRPTGEYGFNALVLGRGHPVGLVAGDDALAAGSRLAAWAERVVVKEGFGTNARPRAIREGATRSASALPAVGARAGSCDPRGRPPVAIGRYRRRWRRTSRRSSRTPSAWATGRSATRGRTR